MSDDNPLDPITAVPTPSSDLLWEITQRLTKIYLREGGLLDIESENIPDNCDSKIGADITDTLADLKLLTISLHEEVQKQAP